MNRSKDLYLKTILTLIALLLGANLLRTGAPSVHAQGTTYRVVGLGGNSGKAQDAAEGFTRNLNRLAKGETLVSFGPAATGEEGYVAIFKR